MKENYSIKDAFKELEILTESEAFRINNEQQRQALDKFMQGDELDDIEMIVDLEAESEEEVKDSYVGNVIIECPVCKSKFYKNKEDIIEDEEQPEYVNVDEECASCGSAGGFIIIGEVAPYNTQEDEEVENEEQEVEPSIGDEETTKSEEEQAADEENIEGEETTEESTEDEIEDEELEEGIAGGIIGGIQGNAAGKAVGQAVGTAAGAAIGSAIAPGTGTAVGAALGSAAGRKLGGAAGSLAGGAAGSAIQNKINQKDTQEVKECRKTKLKEFYEPLKSFKTFQYLNKTKQGWTITKIYHDLDDDRLHVIGCRDHRAEPDYFVGLGYTPDGGHWNQGWYDFRTFEDAEKALKAEYNVEEYIHEPKVEEAIENKKELKGKKLAQAFVDLYKEAGEDSTGPFGERKLTVGPRNEVVFESQGSTEVIYFKEDGSIVFEVEGYLDDWGMDAQEFKNMEPTVEIYENDHNRFYLRKRFNSFKEFTEYTSKMGLTNFMNVNVEKLNEVLGAGLALAGAGIGAGIATAGVAKGLGNAVSGVAQGIGNAIGEDYEDDENELETYQLTKKDLREFNAELKEQNEEYPDMRVPLIDIKNVETAIVDEDGITTITYKNGKVVAYFNEEGLYEVSEDDFDEKLSKKVKKPIREDFNEEDFIENGKELNNDLSYDGEYDLSFEEYCNYFEKEDVENHLDLIEKLYEDYLNLVEDMRDDDYEDFDESLFENLLEKYINQTYDNIEKFKTNKAGFDVDKKTFIIEGVLSLKNGKKGNSKFVFEDIERKENKVIMKGYNETFSKSKKAFKLSSKLEEKKLKPISLNYNYAAKNLTESKRVYGRVILK